MSQQNGQKGIEGLRWGSNGKELKINLEIRKFYDLSQNYWFDMLLLLLIKIMSVVRLYENDITLITTYPLKNNGKNEVAVLRCEQNGRN